MLSSKNKTAGSETPMSTLSTPPKSPFYNVVTDQKVTDGGITWSTSAVADTEDISFLMGAKERPQQVSEGGGDGNSDIRKASDQFCRQEDADGNAKKAPIAVGHPNGSQAHSAAMATPVGNTAHKDGMPPASTLAATRENPLYEHSDASLVPRSPLSTAMRSLGFHMQQSRGGSPKPLRKQQQGGSPKPQNRLINSKAFTQAAPLAPSGSEYFHPAITCCQNLP